MRILPTETANCRKPSGFTNATVTGIWLVSTLTGFCALWQYAGTEGQSGATPSAWPTDTTLTCEAGSPTLLIFAHPLCPCTNTSLDQLESLLRDTRQSVTVVFWNPPSATKDQSRWRDSPLIRRAKKSPHIVSVIDPGGAIAARFAVRTSGHVILYDMHGQLRFSGGVTPGRGHAGDTESTEFLASQLKDTEVPSHTSASQLPISMTFPVFGCPLAPPSTSTSAD